MLSSLLQKRMSCSLSFVTIKLDIAKRRMSSVLVIYFEASTLRDLNQGEIWIWVVQSLGAGG